MEFEGSLIVYTFLAAAAFKVYTFSRQTARQSQELITHGELHVGV